MELERVLRMIYGHVAGMLRDCNTDITKIELLEQGDFCIEVQVFL